MEQPLKEVLGLVQELGGVCSQGVTRVGRVLLARLMEAQTWRPTAPVGFVWGGLNKGTMALLFRESCCALALALKPNNSFSPLMSQLLF